MKNKEVFNNKLEKLEDLYNKYSVLQKIDIKNNGVISDHAYFKNLYADQYVTESKEICNGILNMNFNKF